MSNYLLVVGGLLSGYTLIAILTGLPQLTDFLPLRGSGEGYYKIVATGKTDYTHWYVFGTGVALLVLGVAAKYVLNR